MCPQHNVQSYGKPWVEDQADKAESHIYAIHGVNWGGNLVALATACGMPPSMSMKALPPTPPPPLGIRAGANSSANGLERLEQLEQKLGRFESQLRRMHDLCQKVRQKLEIKDESSDEDLIHVVSAAKTEQEQIPKDNGATMGPWQVPNDDDDLRSFSVFGNVVGFTWLFRMRDSRLFKSKAIMCINVLRVA